MSYELIIPTLLGIESICAREAKRLGYDAKCEDGRVIFSGGADAVARANINIRTGERVLIRTADFTAQSFEELFENTKSVAWEEFIPLGCAFPVKGFSKKSRLASVPDCQAIIKKAIASRLAEKYKMERLPEDKAMVRIQFSIMNDRVSLMIDTSGVPLHKRGYRTEANLAPLRETIAAAMVMISFWKYETPLADLFCGSGTIPIEAAMFKRNIAPGAGREFAAEKFPYIPENIWADARREAKENERKLPLEIYGSDIDARCIKISEENAKRAGVFENINFFVSDAADFKATSEVGAVICNPPYGERLGEKRECFELYSRIGKAFSKYNYWSEYILSSDDDFEAHFGKKANKRRKLYNGMIKCNLYQYFGDRP